ncbi:hypothetical protein DRN58_04820 [Thermococci archaeon]|nr:MAG: hypothetical protein DRN58_04820 [Thermococci archaeon]
MPKYTKEELDKKYPDTKKMIIGKKVKNYLRNSFEGFEAAKGELSDLFYPQELNILPLFFFEEELKAEEISKILNLNKNSVLWTLRQLSDKHINLIESREIRENGKIKKVYRLKI